MNGVNVQTEGEEHSTFSTEQSRLDMSRLLSEYNREIELGNDTNLDILLTWHETLFFLMQGIASSNEDDILQ
jgi:hypothetical protein